ncbi:MAG: phosphatase PAP2 family protein [Pseudomonadota bacterium]
MNNRLASLQRHLSARFSADEVFGLHLTVGALVLIAMAALFGHIAGEALSTTPLTALDARLAAWFHSHKHSAWTGPMLFITHWHNTVGILLMTLLAACYLYRRQTRYWLLALVLTVPGGMLLNVLLKYTFQRARPSFDEPVVTLATYSFPSGHTLSATVLYGFVAAYCVCHTRHTGLRVLAVGAACAMIALVALSRVYLGAHYLSDVLAAAAEGCAWLAICISGVSTWRRARGRQ